MACAKAYAIKKGVSMSYIVGIDIGSTASKAVLIDHEKNIVAKTVVPIGTGTVGPYKALNNILEISNLKFDDIDYIVSTGYGRFSLEEADEEKSELTCHAKAIAWMLEGIEQVIDIGGQDIKVMNIDDRGIIHNFVMNDKCAAGTGRFLDTMARAMNVEIEELSTLSLKSESPAEISSTCTVFAESEVISKLATNVKLEDIAAGIHNSVAHRILVLVNRCGQKDRVALSGGVAKNLGLKSVLEKKLNAKVYIHENCQLAGAIGAALIGLDNFNLSKC